MADPLERYVELLQAGDACSIAALFAEDGEFYDGAPAKLGLDPIAVRGRANIEAFFRQTFHSGGMKVSNMAINDGAMRYDVTVGKRMLLCLGVASVENGLIISYRVVAA